jgi:HD-GYP domain-containing protein (c-di-GMP phosphodiesterase class II)
MALMDFARAIEARDPYSSGHAARVMAIAEVVAARLGWDDDQIDVLRIGAALHDIGKHVVPDTVLRKPGPLDDDEFEHVRAHPEEGARMLELVGTFRAAAPCVLHHHEHWDGSGYPTGRAGSDIPPEARVLVVAYALYAMTLHRCSRPWVAGLHAVAEIERCSGMQFDPDVVAVFAAAWRQGALELPRGRISAAS